MNYTTGNGSETMFSNGSKVSMQLLFFSFGVTNKKIWKLK